MFVFLYSVKLPRLCARGPKLIQYKKNAFSFNCFDKYCWSLLPSALRLGCSDPNTNITFSKSVLRGKFFITLENSNVSRSGKVAFFFCFRRNMATANLWAEIGIQSISSLMHENYFWTMLPPCRLIVTATK